MKRIRLTESQLHKLIEYEIKNVANGLDYRTLLNLANKRRKQSDAQYDKDMEGYYDNIGSVQLIDTPDTSVSDEKRKNRNQYIDKAHEIHRQAKNNRIDREKRIDDIEKYAMEKYGYLHPENQYGVIGKGGEIFALSNSEPNIHNLYIRGCGKGEKWYESGEEEPIGPPKGTEDLNAYLDRESYYDDKLGWITPKDKAKAFWKKQDMDESLARRVTESVIRRLNEWEGNDDEEEDEYNNESTVESLTDAAKKLSAEKVFHEFTQEISRDDEEALIDDIVSEGGPREKYLSDYVEEKLCKPIDLLRQADRYFGTWKTSQWAQEILHQLWWN